MKRYQLINWFIEEYGYSRYLEIGIDNPSACFDLVRVQHKVGVDPNVGSTGETTDGDTTRRHCRTTSDEFFRQNKELFDIMFIDGLHVRDQALRDVAHAEQCLAINGTIIMHDCRPYNAKVGGPERVPGSSWYGTVWQAYAHLRATRADLYMRCVTYDCGLGIVRRGSQKLYTGPYATFEDYAGRQEQILQLIAPADVAAEYGRERCPSV